MPKCLDGSSYLSQAAFALCHFPYLEFLIQREREILPQRLSLPSQRQSKGTHAVPPVSIHCVSQCLPWGTAILYQLLREIERMDHPGLYSFLLDKSQVWQYCQQQKSFYPLKVEKIVFFSSLFNICAKPPSSIIKCYRLKCLIYAGDAQLHLLFYQETENSVIQILIACRNKSPAKY